MAFRRRGDGWSVILRQHVEELRACGAHEAVLRNRLRFLVFLDHGFDQSGWAKRPHTFFYSHMLSDEQVARLAEFIAMHFGEQYRIPIASRWQRAW
jgi:hypothetical protein